MKVVSSADTRLHDPEAEIWVGVRIDGTEVAQRVEVIETALTAAGHEIVTPRTVAVGELETVHHPDLVSFLRDAWAQWEQSGYPSEPGQNRIVPYVFPSADLTSGRPPRRPVSVAALAGLYAIDTMTLIGPGSWPAIEAAAACALTAADLVAGGEKTVYALCRPPGHHAGATFYGGSCYLNNAALATTRLLATVGGPVAIVDIDAHHGNGTQEIFYHRGDVLYGSVHIDPAAGYFPHFLGFPDEEGVAFGLGANRNLVLPPGTGDEEWLEKVGDLAEFASGAAAMVVSLGVDAWRNDPESPLQVSVAGFDMAGQILGSINKPTVVVQEGGYDLASLGGLVSAFLRGFEGHART